MDKILNLEQAKKVSKKLKNEAKTIVLAGGCFDILHLGHFKFLQAAKKQGDISIIALESDENVRRRKGKNRPLNNQEIRAKNLANLPIVDFVIKLPNFTMSIDYQNLVKIIVPDVIAVTKGDPKMAVKQCQAKIVGGKIEVVIDKIPGFSTSNIVRHCEERNDEAISRECGLGQAKRLPRPASGGARNDKIIL